MIFRNTRNHEHADTYAQNCGWQEARIAYSNKLQASRVRDNFCAKARHTAAHNLGDTTAPFAPRLRPCTHSHTTHTQIHVQKCIENAIAVSHKLGVTNDHMSQFFGRCRFLLDCPRKLEWLQTPRKSDGYKRNGESEAQKLLFPFRKNQYFFALCLLLYSYKFSFVRKVSTLHPVADT